MSASIEDYVEIDKLTDEQKELLEYWKERIESQRTIDDLLVVSSNLITFFNETEAIKDCRDCGILLSYYITERLAIIMRDKGIEVSRLIDFFDQFVITFIEEISLEEVKCKLCEKVMKNEVELITHILLHFVKMI